METDEGSYLSYKLNSARKWLTMLRQLRGSYSVERWWIGNEVEGSSRGLF
jgi:hypothetical protein